MPQGQHAVAEIDPDDAPEWLSARSALVVDVREPTEFDAGHVPGAVHIPQYQLADRLIEIPRGRDVLMVCHAGSRSLRCAWFLKQAGYERVTNLRGGTQAWIAAGHPVETPLANRLS
jgi:rhodanese-related sulfurtransferase